MQKTVVVLCGGPSAEHDISLISAKFIMESLDKNLWNSLLIYWHPKGGFYKIHEEKPKDNDHFLPIGQLGFLGSEVMFGYDGLMEKNSEHESFLPMENLLPPRENQKNTDSMCFNNPLRYSRESMIIFPIVHGTGGEDGVLQGFFQTLNYAYVGCDLLSSSLTMDKIFTRILCASIGIKTVPFVTYHHGEKSWHQGPIESSLHSEKDNFDKKNKTKNFQELLDYFQRKLHLLGIKEIPEALFVKTSSLGSSLGLYRVNNEEEYQEAFQQALNYGSKILIEPAFVHIRELECAVLELPEGDLLAPHVGEILIEKRTEGIFYSYDAKYICPHSAKVIFHSNISQDLKNYICTQAKNIFSFLGCSGLSRVDFFLTEDGFLLFNEINTIPGMTPISLWPTLIKEGGYPAKEAFQILLDVAQKNYHYRNSLCIVPPENKEKQNF